MKKQFRNLAFLLPLSIAVMTSVGCNKDDCEPGEDCHNHEQELITKLQVMFSDSATGQAVSGPAFDDPDGVGGNAPTIDTIMLAANTTYFADLKIFAQHDDHADDITAEIEAEKAEHIFCFTPSGGNVSIERTDSDGTFPIGLASRWRAGAAGSGTVTITLKHQPDGAKDGTCVPGDTDIEVVFPVVVQ